MNDSKRLKKSYRVAGHLFAVSIPSEWAKTHERLMVAYRPFETEAEEEPLFHLAVRPTAELTLPADFAEETRQTEEGQTIVSGKVGDGKAIVYYWGGQMALVTSTGDYRTATLHTTGFRLQNAIDNTLMLLFAFATAPLATLLFHSSTVVWQEKGYMFLGTSGTGKSTHSQLWLKNIAGTHLLNDDNPVVRVNEAGTPIVYGSPWSGKTPCYKNEQYPVGAIVKLRQAPANTIRRAGTLDACAAITESVSGKRWEKSIADGLFATTEAVLTGCRTYQLDCLPDDDAANTCWSCVAAHGEGGEG